MISALRGNKSLKQMLYGNTMRIIFVMILCLSSLQVSSKEFQVREKRFYGGDSLELQGLEKGGVSIATIFNSISSFSDKELSIRLLDPLDSKSEREILSFYKNNHNKLKKSAETKHLSPSFMSTSLYEQIVSALRVMGYSANKVSFEKAYVSNEEVFVPDVWIYFTKNI